MDSILLIEPLALARLHTSSPSSFRHKPPSKLLSHPARIPVAAVPAHATVSHWFRSSVDQFRFRRSFYVIACSSVIDTSLPQRNGIYIVGDFMTRKEDLHVVKPTTTVDEALEALVENRITGFPVINDDWKLVGFVSDYDLLALDSISGGGRTESSIFPEVDRTWKTFNEVQKLLNKTNGKVVGDLMTPAPLVVREKSNLEDAARLLLKTKYRRLPVVDGDGKLVGIITRGNVVKAALQLKRANEINAQ